MTNHSHCAPKRWYRKPLYLTMAVTTLALLVSYFVPLFRPFLESFLNFWKIIWWAVLLGLFIGGVIEALVPREYIAKYLTEHKPRTIFNAAILGFLMSACSHGILAIAIELYKKGASAAAVITFLMASPWANLPVTFMLIAFFGWKALVFIGAAIVIAIITGFIYQGLAAKQLIETSPYSIQLANDFSVRSDIKNRWDGFSFTRESITQVSTGVLNGSWNLAHMVLWWIIIGTLLAGALDAFIPHELFQKYLGASFVGLLLTLAFATIIEVCSEGSAPIAFTIYKQTAAFGNTFVFLMAGVATDFTEIGLIWINIGKKAALWLPAVTVPQILILGYLFNLFL